MKVTSEQIGAARALLGLEQEALADRAGVPTSDIDLLEAPQGHEKVDAETLNKVRAALEAAGVQFIEAGVCKRKKV